MEKEAVKEELAAAERAAQAEEAGKGFGHRHFMMLLVALGSAQAYACRVNLSLCIVAMTSKDGAQGYEVFDWDQRQRGLVLSSFFLGYVLMQVPGAQLGNRYGPARFVLLGVAGCSLLTCVTPLAASWGGWKLMCALRVLEGLCQAIIFPCTHYMLGRWSPPVERGRASAIVFSGPPVGALCALAGVGVLCDSPLGWPSGFYVPGLLGLAWSVVWWFLAADSPAKSKRISAEERDFIQASLGTTSSDKRMDVPWMPILRTPAVWAVVAAHMCGNFGHCLMLTQMPNYMQSMLRFEIKGNGLVSALPYLSLTLASALVGWAAQRVNEAHCVSVVASRKIFNTLGHYGMGATFLVVSLLTPLEMPVALPIALLTLAVALEAALVAGFLVNPVDLSPNFGGAILSVSNALGNTMGIAAPIVVSLLVGDAEAISHEELATGWSRVFLVGSCVYFFGNTVFVFMGRADVQPWNAAKDKSESKGGTGLCFSLLADTGLSIGNVGVSKDNVYCTFTEDPAEKHELLKV